MKHNSTELSEILSLYFNVIIDNCTFQEELQFAEAEIKRSDDTVY